MIFLQTLALLLSAAVFAVPLTRRLGLGSIFGYLVAGLAIGPAGFALITDVDTISEVSQFGVIMLLFLVGLELRPARLWVMRRSVLGLGTAQLVVTGGALAVIIHICGYGWSTSIVLGLGLALSSTAIILPLFGERKLLATPAGRDGFAVLLFQDLAFIPLIAFVPLLDPDRAPLSSQAAWWDVGKGVLGIAIVLLGGRYLVKPLFRMIARVKAREIFTAAALLVVAGTAVLVTQAGLSASLGAFMAGVLLSDSEYRHELQADIEPFEGLLLGFFFMSVGMGVALKEIMTRPMFVAAAVAVFIFVKLAVGLVLALLARQDRSNAVRFSTALALGSEFGFVLFGAAVNVGVLTQAQSDLAMLVIGASMMLAPILFSLEERLVAPLLERPDEPEFDEISNDAEPVILCGFGRVGQIVGRLLRLQKIAFVALDPDQTQVDLARRFGNRVFFGDPTRVDLLRAAGAGSATAIVIALGDLDASVQVAEICRRYFPDLKIFARARNRRHAYLLMDRGVHHIVRETLHSSLVLTQALFESLGVEPGQAERSVSLFRDHDERTLRRQHSFYKDEKRLIQSTKEVAEELAALFDADRGDMATEPALPEPRVEASGH